MDKFLNLVISGLVTGAIYSIMASGIVLTYQTSGIFNFSHGAVAFVCAYVYYQLHVGNNVPIVPALILSVFVFAPLLGLLLGKVLLRSLAKAPIYARIVGTIAGVGLASLIVELGHPDEWVCAVLATLCAFGLFFLMRSGYLAVSTLLTAYVVFLLSTAGSSFAATAEG